MAIAFLAATGPLRAELAPPISAPEAASRAGERQAVGGAQPGALASNVLPLGCAALLAVATTRYGRRPPAIAAAGRRARASAAVAAQAVAEAPAGTATEGAAGSEGAAVVETSSLELEAGEEIGEEEAQGEPKAAEFELLALPFLPKPAYRAFVRNVPGDAGFDPLNLAGEGSEGFLRMFDAELKHGRLAMLAFAGFAGAESLHEVLAEKLGLPDLIGENGCTPTFFNGGIFEPFLLGAMVPILGLGAFLELSSPKNTGLPGYYGFDPLRFGDIKFSDFARSLLRSDVEWVAEAEMKHGRLAMLAVTWCFIQETVTREPIFPEI